MTRAFITLNTLTDRARATSWVAKAPPGTRLEFKRAKRTLPQNDKFWAMLTEIAVQKEHCGRRYPPQIWKALVMHAWGDEVTFVPSLDEKGVVPIMFRSSDLSKAEMAELIEFMIAWGAQHGIKFSGDGDENMQR